MGVGSGSNCCHSDGDLDGASVSWQVAVSAIGREHLRVERAADRVSFMRGQPLRNLTNKGKPGEASN